MLKDNAFGSTGTAAGEDDVRIFLASVAVIKFISQYSRSADSLSRHGQYRRSQGVSSFGKSR
jgi:hypothetical protein